MYRLFALRSTAKVLEELAEERFVRSTARYTLVLTEKESFNSSVEITVANFNRLTESDKRWLSDCCSALVYEEMIAHEKDISESIGEQIKALEQALKEQREKINEN